MHIPKRHKRDRRRRKGGKRGKRGTQKIHIEVNVKGLPNPFPMAPFNPSITQRDITNPTITANPLNVNEAVQIVKDREELRDIKEKQRSVKHEQMKREPPLPHPPSVKHEQMNREPPLPHSPSVPPAQSSRDVFSMSGGTPARQDGEPPTYLPSRPVPFAAPVNTRLIGRASAAAKEAMEQDLRDRAATRSLLAAISAENKEKGVQQEETKEEGVQQEAKQEKIRVWSTGPPDGLPVGISPWKFTGKTRPSRKKNPIDRYGFPEEN